MPVLSGQLPYQVGALSCATKISTVCLHPTRGQCDGLVLLRYAPSKRGLNHCFVITDITAEDAPELLSTAQASMDPVSQYPEFKIVVYQQM